MLTHPIRWLASLVTGRKAAPSDPAAPRPSALDFDPVWHGDHWQNLLSSPMDARHYVMEDWSLPTSLDDAAPAR